MSAPKKRPTSTPGAVLGFIGFSVLAGLLVTIGVTPALAVSSLTATSSIGLFQSLPNYLAIGQLQQRNTLYATSDGKEVPFATLYDQNRVNLKWNEVSDNLKFAAVDGEDRRFYDHGGVDLTSIVRAGLGSVSKGSLGAGGGGSTLTMQLVKNILLAEAQNEPDLKKQQAEVEAATDTSLQRKLQEMKLAIGLEKTYSKDQILLAYLNIAYFGDQAYGVEAASEHYFNKSAKDLTPAEAASLIAIVQFPNSRDLSSPTHYAANVARRDVILDSMLDEKTITPAQHDQALAQKPADYVHLTAPTQGCAAVTWAGAQNFCDYVQRNVPNYGFLGTSAAQRQANWKTGGYDLYTTLNLDLTAAAKEQIDSYAPNTETRLDLGGVVDSVQPGTGRVVVMAQNKDYTQGAGTATQTALNYSVDSAYGSSQGFQTGSTYKAFTLLDWLNKGHGVDEYVNATPRIFNPMTRCGASLDTADATSPKGYNPKNDEGYIRGNMSVLTATSLSVNVAYVAMAQQLDLCDIGAVATSMGVHQASGAPVQTLAASVLGTNYIAPLTMANAYAAIANNGVYCAPIIVDKAIGPDGKDLGGQPKSCKQVISPDVAHAAVYALKSTLTGGGTAVGARPVGGPEMFAKTGTTDAADQIWLIGSTSALTTATWMGNVKGKVSLRNVYGPHGQYANSRAALFRAVMTADDRVYPGSPFAPVSHTSLIGQGVSVPDLTGQDPATAEASLSTADLNYADGGTQPSSLPAGQISGTSPAAGVTVAKGTTITVYTSDGSGSSVAMPMVTGQRYSAALEAIASAGFDASHVTASFVKGDDSQKCVVVGTNPSGGTSAAKSSTVTVTVGGGKDGKDPGNC